MASNNPANFANISKDKLREIAAKGGHASHEPEKYETFDSAPHHEHLLRSGNPNLPGGGNIGSPSGLAV
jgi:hypothetical protein